jgi:hypothetical protein
VDKTVYIDIDGASFYFDSYLRLYDNSGTQLSASDDGVPSDAGSAQLCSDCPNTRDSYLRYNFPSASTYYIKVSRYFDEPIPGQSRDLPSGASYTLNVSVPDHKIDRTPDTTPPQLNMPADITEQATGPAGARVSWQAPTATDEDPAHPDVSCSPASGSTFVIGNTTVNCSATDAPGNKANDSFTVKVQDTAGPNITNVPSGITEEATSTSGATVTFNKPTATDTVDGARTVNCSPDSGSTFPLGTTEVTCSASDARGNTARARFNVTVRDTTGPVLSLPDDKTVEATGASGAEVNYTANDAVDGSISVNCTPASGSTFALTTTTVSCSANDAADNTAQASIKVTVVDTTAPSVVVSPADSATNVVLKTINVTASFSEAVHNVNTNTFKLERKIVSKKATKYQPVAATVTTRDNDTTAVLDPSKTLWQGDYRATLTGGVINTAGNALANAPYSWDFTVK